jgi:hypothetical protein
MRARVEQALAAFAANTNPDERLEMRLCATQGALLVIARGAPRGRRERQGLDEDLKPLPSASTMPSTNCARSGACGPFTSTGAGIGIRWNWPKNSSTWRKSSRLPMTRSWGGG